jgi:hypothetical protein
MDYPLCMAQLETVNKGKSRRLLINSDDYVIMTCR